MSINHVLALFGGAAVLMLLSLGIVSYVEHARHEPPHYEDQCIKYETNFYPMVYSDGKTTSIQMTPIDTCVQSRSVCVVGDLYRGPVKDCQGN